MEKHTWKILSSNPTDGLEQDGLWDPHYEAPAYPIFFLYISKFSNILHYSSVGWFHCK